MRQPPTTETATCGCAVTIAQIYDELQMVTQNIHGGPIVAEAERLGMTLVTDWTGAPALPTADAARLVAEWRVRTDAHYAQWAAYVAWRDQQIRAAAEAAQAKRTEDDRRWTQANAKLGAEARAAAEAKRARELEEYQRAQAQAAGLVSFEKFLKGRKAS